MPGESLTPSRTRKILNGLEHFPKKKLGQNFLIDGNIVQKSCRLAELQPEDAVIEIGPGLGALTQALLKTGAHVYAIEADSVLAAYLEPEFLSKYPARFHLMQADAVANPLAGYVPKPDADGELEDFKIVSNLPYAISSPWLNRVLAGPLPSTMVLMLQQETADRYAAGSGSKNFGAITVFLQSAYNLVEKHKVSPNCFYPIPAVDSVILKLVRKNSPITFSEKSTKKIRSLFTQRRKQIGALCRKDPTLTPWIKFLEETGIPLQSRPENLTLTAWQKLNNIYSMA